MQKWEYLIERGLDANDQDQLGKDGWELVTVVWPTGLQHEAIFYLKRPISS